MDTLTELLNSKGRDFIPENQIERLGKKDAATAGQLVKDAYAEARAGLGAGASDDAIAKRAALLFLKSCGVIPAKQPKPAPEAPAPETPAEE